MTVVNSDVHGGDQICEIKAHKQLRIQYVCTTKLIL